MSRRAWAYIWSVLVVGAALAVAALPTTVPAPETLPTFLTMTVLATLAQLFMAQAPSHQAYYATLVFVFAALLLLPPALFVLLVVVYHLIEWVKERRENTPLGRIWYIQPFNIAADFITGFAARWVYLTLTTHMELGTLSSIVVGPVAALTFLLLNHLLIGQALVLARGIPWRQTGVLDGENLLSDYVLLLLGYVVAVLWELNPWLMIPAISPLVLMYRALMIPQLKQEAQTDAKTGLYNARHFNKLYTAELDRAARFGRPLAVIMADLDLMRNINNTYGHLAGDAVLMGISAIIRKTTREYDIAGRFGGEEFCIVLPEVTPNEARALAERLRAAVATAQFEVNTNPTPLQATMSIGVACFPLDATTVTGLIHEADVAVYQAKQNGRNQVVCAADVPHAIKAAHQATTIKEHTPAVASAVPPTGSATPIHEPCAGTNPSSVAEEHSYELQPMNTAFNQAQHELLAANPAMQQLNDELFLILSKIVDTRDPLAADHANKVAAYAIIIAAELGFDADRIEQVRQAALLHDIGKVVIPAHVLQKPERLTSAEYEDGKAHAGIGAEFVATARSLRHLAPLIKHHHERWDGRGYPDGLSATDIPLEARILAICDAVAEMLTDRPYQPGRSLPEVVAELQYGRGTQFDPHLVDIFVQVAERRHISVAGNSALSVTHIVSHPPTSACAESNCVAPA